MSSTDDRIPVTVISGVLGAGKTTLVNRLLRDSHRTEIAVIVNDMGEVNVDADLIERDNPETGIVDLSNGCICCELKGDLVEGIVDLAERRAFDVLVIEASGISEPTPIARSLTESRDEDPDPTDRFRLDTMVTVLDAYGFWKEFDAGASLPAGAPDPERPLAEVLVQSVEFCDVLLINKSDMVPDNILDEIRSVITELNPRATIRETEYADVDPSLVVDTSGFDFADASRSVGWKQRLRESRAESDQITDDHDHSGTAHAVDSFVYRRRRPFDPNELAECFGERPAGVIRAKGICHIAGSDEVLGMNRAGASVQAGAIGSWDDDEPRTELVFIGTDMDREEIEAGLDDCLLDDDVDRDAAETNPFPIQLSGET